MSRTIHPAPAVLTVGIVLHFSELDRLAHTLVALDRAVAASPFDDVAVCLVDQSLCDDYAARVTERLNALTLSKLTITHRRMRENGGYGAGQNRAFEWLAETNPDGVHLILNPDAELSESALNAGLDIMERVPEAALLAPIARDAAGQHVYLAKDYPSLRALLIRGFGPHWLAKYCDGELARYELRQLAEDTAPAVVPLASGACMLVRSRDFAAVNGFDERFFLYFEDYDLSLRLAALGPVMQVPAMTMVHHGGGAAAKGVRHVVWFLTSAIRFFSRWGWRLW